MCGSGLVRLSICKILCASALVFALTNCHPLIETSTRIPKAIFIIVDGIPADIMESTQTPNLDSIAGSHGYTRSYVGGEIGGMTQSPTVSAVGYNSLLTGTWANKHNVYTNRIENPNYSYWDIFRIARHQNLDISTALFSTWQDNRTRLVGDGLPEAGGSKLDYAFDGLELDEARFPHDEAREFIRAIDNAVSTEAAHYLRDVGPELSWVYLEYTDDIGHVYGEGDELTAAVAIMDANVGKIWKAVQDRQKTHGENWLVVVTTDHGRDEETGKSHGGQSLRERTTWIATNSQRLNSNFENLPGIVDILPSILDHLAIVPPPRIAAQLDGVSFIDRQDNEPAR